MITRGHECLLLKGCATANRNVKLGCFMLFPTTETLYKFLLNKEYFFSKTLTAYFSNGMNDTKGDVVTSTRYSFTLVFINVGLTFQSDLFVGQLFPGIPWCGSALPLV